MKRNKVFLLMAFIVLLLLLPLAARGAGLTFAVPWWTVDGGGGRSEAGSFAVTGTIGQPDAAGESAGSTFAVSGGFWAASGQIAQPEPERLYLPIVVGPP